MLKKTFPCSVCIVCIYPFISSYFRLYWPRSKSYDYLFSDGEALLRNFPVQATINFYDESDSEEEEDSCDEDDDSDTEECLKPNSHFTSYNWMFILTRLCNSDFTLRKRS